jgi:hypothetical protein
MLRGSPPLPESTAKTRTPSKSKEAPPSPELVAKLERLGFDVRVARGTKTAASTKRSLLDMNSFAPSEQALAVLSAQEARRLCALPIRLRPESLIVAVANPSPCLESQLSEITGINVELVTADEDELRRSISAFYPLL